MSSTFSIERKHFRAPVFSLRFAHVWRRNFLVWRKLAIPSVIGNLADPLLFMLGLGYGLGALMPEVNGVSYIAFLAAGTLCYSTMNTASFEAMYSAFSRMHVQKTWEAILNAPLTLDDVLVAEAAWAASKSFLSGLAILVVIWALGLSESWLSLWIIPLTVVIGACFASLGLVITALAPSYEFFMYYMTLVMTPMMLLSGAFFPREQLPQVMQDIALFLPLTHAVDLARPLLRGDWVSSAATHLVVLIAYALAAFYVALVLSRRRLLK